MHKFLTFVCLLWCAIASAQYEVSGVLSNKETQEPLAFANVISESGTGTITNRDGHFSIVQKTPFKNITFSYIGYLPKTIEITKEHTYLNVTLSQNTQELNEVTVSYQDSIALNLIHQTIANKKYNNPEKALESFQFLSYSKLLVTANPDSISSTIDTVYTIKNGKRSLAYIDSSDYDLKKRLEKSHLYITEKISKFKFNHSKGKRENVLANRMAGFDKPVYEAMAIQMQSFSFYDDVYTIFETPYTGPISNYATREYNYKIIDTITLDNHTCYVVYYKPKSKEDIAGLQGLLFINAETYALQKAIAQLKGNIDVNAEQNFTYLPEPNIWFPENKTLIIKKGDTNETVSLFGGRIKIEDHDDGFKRDSTVIRTDDKDDSAAIQMILKEQNSDIKINKPVEIKGRGLEITFDDNAFNRNEHYWNMYRTDSITRRGLETYEYIDSLGKAEDFKNKINFVLKITNGYLPTKYVDMDLRYLLKYNSHEGFRLGMGATTNKTFSTRYKIHGYSVYGTKDKRVKYGIGADARLHKFTNTWAGFMYTDDLVETGNHDFITDGRAFYVFQPRLFNIETFQRSQSINVNVSHNITSKARIKVQLEKSEIDPTYAYSYVHRGETFHEFTTTEATAALSYQPFSRFMLTPDGFSQIERGFPTFTFQVQQGFAGFLDGDFHYTKLNLRAHYELQPLEKGKTTFTLKGGIAFGELPITELFHTNPNNPNRASIMRRFSVAGVDNFETMYFNEFYSDKYMTLMGRHDFTPFKINNKIKPQLTIFSKFGIGDIDNLEKHRFIASKKMDKGYYESGLELNNIVSGFGLSAAYRYGPYHLDRVDDNISFKFTYTFKLNL